ncbi:MAG: YwqG family protein [Coriobacteriia bacterium]|nr:YwqG family protein [Coriobacteriia bacterium]
MDWTIVYSAVGVCAALLAGYLIRRNLKKPPAQRQPSTSPLKSLEPDEKAALFALFEPTAMPFIRLTPALKPTGVFDCKVGGTPYLPPLFDYPHNTSPGSNGGPLRLLVQLNFGQLPHLPGYPQNGILQVYIADDSNDDLYGLDRQHPTAQAAWRVVYHKDIVDDERRLQPAPPLDDAKEAYFPLNGEFGLEAQLAEQALSRTDYRWNAFFEQTVAPSPLYQSLQVKYSELELEIALAELTVPLDLKVGGYPQFTQADPRDGSGLEAYSQLLVQLDSWEADNGMGILFGDYGVANWFIKPSALAARDFSDILYNWDCY